MVIVGSAGVYRLGLGRCQQDPKRLEYKTCLSHYNFIRSDGASVFLQVWDYIKVYVHRMP